MLVVSYINVLPRHRKEMTKKKEGKEREEGKERKGKKGRERKGPTQGAFLDHANFRRPQKF